MFCELFGLLIGLDKQWRSQGASAKELDLSAFGWDHVPLKVVPANFGVLSELVPRVIEDNGEFRITTDNLGRKMKLCKESATIPLPMDYPIKTMDDWLGIKHWYEFREDRIDREKLSEIKKAQEEGYLIIGSMLGGFDEPRQLMGEEELCVSFYEQPELIEDILNTIADTALKIYDRVLDVVSIDNLCVHEDLAGKSGPLVGPNLIGKFIKPYYRKIWDAVSSKGCTIFSQDSDGNMNSVIDAFLDCGLTAMYPCEPQAGMDIVEIRKKYPGLALKGGIDKFALRGDKEDIRRELEYKMGGVTMGGGTVFALDHRIPDGVSIENYRFYVNLGREILGLPPFSSESHFTRMAF
ncbi:MAG: hypothetical protein LBQ48_07950 [Oscillospiraceae bacterium]|nr:hypothetical protein [Oscillospiraceae bacterium]